VNRISLGTDETRIARGNEEIVAFNKEYSKCQERAPRCDDTDNEGYDTDEQRLQPYLGKLRRIVEARVRKAADVAHMIEQLANNEKYESSSIPALPTKSATGR
jgi:hypothetical protein